MYRCSLRALGGGGYRERLNSAPCREWGDSTTLWGGSKPFCRGGTTLLGGFKPLHVPVWGVVPLCWDHSMWGDYGTTLLGVQTIACVWGGVTTVLGPFHVGELRY